MVNKVFNSHEEFYRSPVGAINNSESIHFKIVLERSLKCSAAKLIIIDDETNKREELFMFWCQDFLNGKEAWECDFKPFKEGIFWYKFEIDTAYGKKFIVKGNFGEGKIVDFCKDSMFWQITVYDKNFVTPSWLNGGVMYQIFPDRFFNSGEEKKNVPSDRILKREWGEDFLKENGSDINNCFYGGDLKGIEKKLSYLKELGVTCIYLNPIFEAHSNHRYNTADYLKVDPMLGTEDDFKSLCAKAKEFDIRVILDGVFSHTGSDSVYFNKNKRYSTIGAYNKKESKYFKWYKFFDWPNGYTSWWGFDTLPEVNEENSDYCDFITGKSGVLNKWLSCGASGWRLDVADELPDSFLQKVRSSVKSCDENALVLGEVWEDASNKESYGYRRKYLLGKELDSVMNYPFREAIIDFIRTRNSINIFNIVLNIVENYPKKVLNILMNMLSTHDTERILTVVSNTTSTTKNDCLDFIKLAVAIQYTLPGLPSIFYGDEAGIAGGKDPFCRKCYPWGRENKDLINFYKKMGEFRKLCSCLKTGKFIPIFIDDKTFSYKREDEESKLFCYFNIESNKNLLDSIFDYEGYRMSDSIEGRYFSLYYLKKEGLQK